MVRYKAFDPWKRIYKGCGHIGSLKLAGCQHERSDLRRCQRHSFRGSVADAIILGEHDPATLPNFNKPIFVFSVGRKAVVVNLYGLAHFPQRFSDDLPAEGTV